MTFSPGKPNFGSSVGCGDTLLVHEMVEATARAKGGTGSEEAKCVERLSKRLGKFQLSLEFEGKAKC